MQVMVVLRTNIWVILNYNFQKIRGNSTFGNKTERYKSFLSSEKIYFKNFTIRFVHYRQVFASTIPNAFLSFACNYAIFLIPYAKHTIVSLKSYNTKRTICKEIYVFSHVEQEYVRIRSRDISSHSHTNLTSENSFGKFAQIYSQSIMRTFCCNND